MPDFVQQIISDLKNHIEEYVPKIGVATIGKWTQGEAEAYAVPGGSGHVKS